MTVPCAAAGPLSGDAFINPGSTDSRATHSLIDPMVIAMSRGCSIILEMPDPHCKCAAVQQCRENVGGECGVVYNQRQRMPQQPGWDAPTLNTNASGANLRLYYSFEYGKDILMAGTLKEIAAIRPEFS